MTPFRPFSLRDLVERERLHPAIIRRLDGTCILIKVCAGYPIGEWEAEILSPVFALFFYFSSVLSSVS
jgi:hypothetical protein